MYDLLRGCPDVRVRPSGPDQATLWQGRLMPASQAEGPAPRAPGWAWFLPSWQVPASQA